MGDLRRRSAQPNNYCRQRREISVFQDSVADYLIAIGGGSPQDTCKAIGIISNNPGFADVRSLKGLSPTNKPSVPILAKSPPQQALRQK